MSLKPKVARVPEELVDTMRNDLSAPMPEKVGNSYFVDAAQFEAWRSSQSTSRHPSRPAGQTAW